MYCDDDSFASYIKKIILMTNDEAEKKSSLVILSRNIKRKIRVANPNLNLKLIFKALKNWGKTNFHLWMIFLNKTFFVPFFQEKENWDKNQLNFVDFIFIWMWFVNEILKRRAFLLESHRDFFFIFFVFSST